MSELVNSTQTIADRIKLPYSFDVAKMQEEVLALNLRYFIYYSVIPLSRPERLKGEKTVEDYADGSWANWIDTELLKTSPYLTSIVDTFRKYTKVTLVRLLRLEAGAVVKEHVDPTLGLEIEKSVVRLTIPIFSENEVEFYLNNEIVPMQPGECWYLRLTDPHKILHKGTTERINMTIDMIPNEWVRSMILNAETV